MPNGQPVLASQESFKLQQVMITAMKLRDKKERLQELAGHGGAQLQHELLVCRFLSSEPCTVYSMWGHSHASWSITMWSFICAGSSPKSIFRQMLSTSTFDHKCLGHLLLLLRFLHLLCPLVLLFTMDYDPATWLRELFSKSKSTVELISSLGYLYPQDMPSLI